MKVQWRQRDVLDLRQNEDPSKRMDASLASHLPILHIAQLSGAQHFQRQQLSIARLGDGGRGYRDFRNLVTHPFLETEEADAELNGSPSQVVVAPALTATSTSVVLYSHPLFCFTTPFTRNWVHPSCVTISSAEPAGYGDGSTLSRLLDSMDALLTGGLRYETVIFRLHQGVA